MSRKKRTKKDDYSLLSMRERILKDLRVVSDDLPKRDLSVMTRLSSVVVDILDALVKLDFFSSRSEAVAAIVEQRIYSNLDLFNTIREQAKKIEGLQDELESLTLKALKD